MARQPKTSTAAPPTSEDPEGALAAEDASEVGQSAKGPLPAAGTREELDGATAPVEAEAQTLTDETEHVHTDPDADEVALDVEAAPAEALPSLIEALLFVSDGPVELRSIARALGVAATALDPAVQELRARLDGRGLILQTGPEGAQLVTAPHAAQYVEAFLGLEQHRRLSNAALETLAIVAYRQPVTRATIESIRGVSSDGAMQTLRARGLIEEAGRSQSPGRPTLFVTTQRFLEHFGLNSPHDLPDLGAIELPPPDTSIPMPGLDGSPMAATPIEEVAEALTSLSAAARALADPRQPRPGATALLLPGPMLLSLPSPARNLPDATNAQLPRAPDAAPWP